MSRHRIMSVVYFCLALIGLVWSWSWFVRFPQTVEGSLSGAFLQSVLVNPASAGVAIDALMAGAVFSVMAVTRANSDGVRWPWFYVVTCFLIGLCVALPLYLGFSERQAQSTSID